MAREEILVVEDEEDILELLNYNLSKEGYSVRLANCGEDALEKIKEKAPDLILLDLMLPGIDGLEVCRQLKRDPQLQRIPVIMLTAKTEDIDIVTGLEVGADDYLTKPFGTRVLVARIRTVLRRQTEKEPTAKEIIKINDIAINQERHQVEVEGKTVNLTLSEFRLLLLLARRPGIVFSRYQIQESLHGDTHLTTDRSVDVQVVGLRKKLGKAGKHIETVRGVGYRLRD